MGLISIYFLLNELAYVMAHKVGRLIWFFFIYAFSLSVVDIVLLAIGIHFTMVATAWLILQAHINIIHSNDSLIPLGGWCQGYGCIGILKRQVHCWPDRFIAFSLTVFVRLIWDFTRYLHLQYSTGLWELPKLFWFLLFSNKTNTSLAFVITCTVCLYNLPFCSQIH